MARSPSRIAIGWRWTHHAALLLLLAACTCCALRAMAFVWEPPVSTGPRFREARPALMLACSAAVAAGLFSLGRCARAWARGTWDSTSFRPFRLLFYTCVAGAMAFQLLLQPYWEFYARLAGGLVLGAFACAFACGPYVANRVPPRWLHAADVAAMNAGLALLVLELGTRAWARVHPSALTTPPDSAAVERLTHYRYAPGTAVYGFRCDDRGWYDEPPRPRGPGESLVCSISDSFATGTTHQALHFTTVCERALPGCQVYNMGAVDTGPREYRHILESEALWLRPDAVLICIYLGNDVTDALRAARPQHALRRWLDREQLLSYQVATRLATLWRERNRSGHPARVVGAVQGMDAAAVSDTSLEGLARLFPWYLDPALEEPTVSYETYLDLMTWRAERTCGPDTEIYTALFEQLRAMKSVCDAIPMYVLLIAEEFQIEDQLWRDVVARSTLPALDRAQPQRIVSDWLEQEGIPYVDALPALRAVPPTSDGRRHVFHKQDPHFNRRGNEATGLALAEFLRTRLAR